MDVGKNLNASLPAQRPERGTSRGVECDPSVLICVGIEVVVTDETGRDAVAALRWTEQERAALASSTATAAKLKNDPSPEQDGNANLNVGGIRRQRSLPG